MPRIIGGTPNASAMSRLAAFFASMKSMSFGVRPIAFQQHRPAGARSTAIAFLEFLLEPLILLLGKVAAFLRRIDQRAGGACRVVEQRLVPPAGGVVDIQCHQRGLQRRKAVMIIKRMEEP